MVGSSFDKGLDLVPQKNSAGSLTNFITAYEFDFFSGSQIGIYIGDILVDDIESIQYVVTQTKRPIYGYGSQYWHTVADGQVLAEGTFSIPFKEADYILAVLDRYISAQTPIEEIIPLLDPHTGKSSQSSHAVMRENIERYLARINDSESATNPYDLAQSLSALKDENFENIAEDFEDILWRQPKDKFLEPNIKFGLDSSRETRRGDQYPPFDIYILYGDIANQAANHTIKKLIDVSLIGQGQTIFVGGEPIKEQYRFLCRNVA